jgi:hypothetical protein
MKRVRQDRRHRRSFEDRTPILPLDPRDPEIARAKQSARNAGSGR